MPVFPSPAPKARAKSTVKSKRKKSSGSQGVGTEDDDGEEDAADKKRKTDDTSQLVSLIRPGHVPSRADQADRSSPTPSSWAGGTAALQYRLFKATRRMRSLTSHGPP